MVIIGLKLISGLIGRIFDMKKVGITGQSGFIGTHLYNYLGIKALEEGSKLIVFSSNTLEDGKDDDYRFDANMWFDWENI